MSETKKAKSGGNIFKIIIIVLFIIILVGGAAFGGYLISAKSSAKANAGTEAKEKEAVEEAFFPAGDYLVNLADEGGKRYLKATISIAYDSGNKKLPKELESKKDVITDSIISVMRTKKVADMSAKGSEDLKKEIITRLNSVLSSGKLTNIYYNNFLVQ